VTKPAERPRGACPNGRDALRQLLGLEGGVLRAQRREKFLAMGQHGL